MLIFGGSFSANYGISFFSGDADLMYVALKKDANEWITNLNIDLNDKQSDEPTDPLQDVAMEYFSSLDRSTILKLFEIYKMDFDLFGYDPSEFLKKGQQQMA